MSRLLRPRVLLADDHRMVAEGLRSLLSNDFELVGVVEDGHALIAAAKKLRPDIIIADISMAHLNGIDALVQLRQHDPEVRVIFLTMHPEVAYARRAFEAGATGYVLKHSAPAELVEAIRAALSGKSYLSPALVGAMMQGLGSKPALDPITQLTPRQREILQLFAEGLSAKEIAASLAVSTRTVEFHKYQVMERLHLHTGAELVHFAIKHGLVAI